MEEKAKLTQEEIIKIIQDMVYSDLKEESYELTSTIEIKDEKHNDMYIATCNIKKEGSEMTKYNRHICKNDIINLIITKKMIQ